LLLYIIAYPIDFVIAVFVAFAKPT